MPPSQAAGVGRQHVAARSSRLAALTATGVLLLALAGAQQAAAQSTNVLVTRAAATNSFSWALTKTASTNALTVPVGGDVSITYTITATRTLGSMAGQLSFDVECVGPTALGADPVQLLTVAATVNGVATPVRDVNTPVAQGARHVERYNDLPVADASTPATIVATCTFDTGATADTKPATFTAGPGGVGATASLTDALVYPAWATFFQPPHLAKSPTPIISQGSMPNARTLTGSEVITYTVTIPDIFLCLTNAQIVNGAVLTPSDNVVATGSPATSTVALTTANNCQFDSPTLVVTYNARLAVIYDWALTKTVSSSALTVARGNDAVLDYTLTATRSEKDTARSLDSLSVAVSNPATGFTTTLDRCTLVDGGTTLATQAASTTVNAGQSTTVRFSSVSIPAGSAGTSLTVQCFFDGGTTPVSQGVSVTYPTTPDTTEGASAQIKDTFTYPTWSSYFVSPWLITAPAATVTGTNPNSMVVSASTTYTYTLTISNILLCFTSATISNQATLTPSGTSSSSFSGAPKSATTTTTISITGCDTCVTYSVDRLETTSTVTNSWSSSMAPVAASGAPVPWGQGATIPMRATFTKTAASSVSTLTAQLTISNPSAGPALISNIQLQCQWGATLSLPCGTAVNSLGGTASSLLVPGGGSTQCMFTNLPVSAGIGTNFLQPCNLVATLWSGRQCISDNFVIDFGAGAMIRNDINNCLQYSVNCGPAQGTAFYNPAVGGGLQSTQVCLPTVGSGGAASVTDSRDFDVTVSGGFQGDGTQPGACSGSASVTCTATGTGVTTVGSGASGGNLVSGSATLTFNPTSCPLPVPSPSPTPSPSPSPGSGGGGFLGTGDPDVSVVVDRTAIEGAFDWTLTNAADPTSLLAAVGANDTTTYTVAVTRVPASDASAPRYFLGGAVTVSNPSATAVIKIETVSAVVGPTSVPLNQCSLPLPITLQPGMSVRCTFYFAYNNGPTPDVIYGRAGAESAMGVVLPVDSPAAAPFSFSTPSTITDAAAGVCANVSMVFNTDFLELTRVSGDLPSFSAEQPTRVCESTVFKYVVAAAPRPGTPCGPQQLVNTVSADYVRGELVRRVARSNVVLDVTGGCGSAGGDGGGSAPAPAVPASNGGGAAPGPGSIQVQGVSSKAVTNVVWGLAMEPLAEGLPLGTEATSAAFNISWTKSTEQVNEYTGSIVISSPAGTALQLDGVTIELVDALAPAQATIAQAAASCPLPAGGSGMVSESTLLAINGTVTCSFTLKGPIVLGGALVATISAADSGESISSPQYSVTQFSESTAQEGCASLLAGLAASTLVPGGRLVATPDGVSSAEVCEPGSKVVTFSVLPPAPSTPCGSYPLTAAARLQPSVGTDSAPIAAAASMQLELSEGCSDTPVPLAVGIASTRAFRTRNMKWSVAKVASPAVTQTIAAPATLNVTTTFTRTLERGQLLSIEGDVAVSAVGEDTSALQQVKVLAMPLCVGGAACSAAAEAALTCNSSETAAGTTCTFKVERLPPVPALLLAIASAPLPDEPAAFINTNVARRTVQGRCALLSDAAPTLEPPAGVSALVSGDANPPPATPVCDPSWIHTFQLVLSVNGTCNGPTKLSSPARAAPTDGGGDVAVADLAFEVSCAR